MTDRKFTELLNLYLDDEISPEDAAALEREIQRSPERRRLYRRYCQMQRACVMLADRFRAQEPVGGRSLAFVRANRFRSIGWPQLAYGLSGAVAACLVVGLVVLAPFEGGGSDGAERVVASSETTPQRNDAAAAVAASVAAPAANGGNRFFSPEEARFPASPPPAAFVMFENPWRRAHRDRDIASGAPSPLTPLQSDFGRSVWEVPEFAPVSFGHGAPTIFVGRERPGAATVDFTAFPFQR